MFCGLCLQTLSVWLVRPLLLAARVQQFKLSAQNTKILVVGKICLA